MFDVITVGSATVDVFAKTDSDQINIRTRDTEEEFIAYPAGTKILINRLDFQIGGGGTNTAVSFSRLGLSTAYLGNLGRDDNGDKVIKLLRDEGVEFIGTRSGHPTGYSVILDSIADDRTILTYKGANSELDYGSINKATLNTRWFYFSSMLGNSFKSLLKLSLYARQRSIPIAFNPSSYQALQGTNYLKDLLSRTELLVLNREEAEYLVGRNPHEELLRNLRVLGPKIVVVTDGKKGAHSYDGSYHYYMPANSVKIKETTGAGDAFASGFLAGLIIKKDIGSAMNIGMANATSVIRHLGAKNRLLTLKEALRMCRKNRKAIKTRLRMH